MFWTLLLSLSADFSSWIVGNEINHSNWKYYDELRIGSFVSINSSGHTQCLPNQQFMDAKHLFMNQKTKIISSAFDPTPCINDPLCNYCQNIYNTLPQTFEDCGGSSIISGLEFDYEWGGTYHTKNHGMATNFTLMMNYIQRHLGNDYTVSADVGVNPFETPWVDAKIFKQNSKLVINTMSYHTPRDCSIFLWIADANIVTYEWGISPQQTRIGIGFFSVIRDHKGKIVREPLYKDIEEICPNQPTRCICNGVSYVSSIMAQKINKFSMEHRYKGLFPWASNYDSITNSIISQLSSN